MAVASVYYAVVKHVSMIVHKDETHLGEATPWQR
jgi:hypothetical protein